MMNLLDRYIRKNAIESISEWPIYPKHHPPESCIKVLTEGIVEPLEKWLSSEMGKGKDYISMDSGRAFMQAAYDMVVLYEKDILVGPEYVVRLNEKWREFQSEMGFDSIMAEDEYKSSQQKKAKKTRNKALKDMVAKLAKRRNLFGEPWAAKDLWPLLYSMMEEAGMSPKEINSNRNQPNTWKILYKKDEESDKLISLTFRTFKNRLSLARN